jgi:hypothetical protein
MTVLTSPLATGQTTARRAFARRLVRPGREIALAAVLYLIYRAGRLAVTGQEAVAIDHARLVHRFENAIGLPSEAAIQTAISSADVFRAANVYYVTMHFPALIAFLGIGLLLRPPAEYAWARNLLVVQTGAALLIHMLFPLAPPRMFPQWGFVDTMSTLGPSAYDGAGASVANQFAAMPSLHVGWTVLFAVVVVRTGPRWAGALAIVHSIVTTVVVVITANHWIVDAAASVALLGVALAIFPAPGRCRVPLVSRTLRPRPVTPEGQSS